MKDSPFDRNALRAYMDLHGISGMAMAAHAGVPYRTLRYILFNGREPRQKSRAALERAMQLPPPPKRLPAHAEEIMRLWPKCGSTLIGRQLGISKNRVLQIAKVLGLGHVDRPRREFTIE